MTSLFRETRPKTRRRFGRALLAVSAVALLTGTAACSSSGGTSSSSTEAGGAPVGTVSKTTLAQYSAKITDYGSISAVAGGVGAMKGKTVWWVPIGASLPFMGAIGDGMKAALAKMGASLHICDGKLLPTAIASCLDDAGSRGAAAVVTGYIDYSLVPNAFDSLVAKHIPVLIAGESPSGGKKSSPQLAFYDTIKTQTRLQKIMADVVIADSGGKAKILYLASTDSPQLTDTAKYAKKYYATQCPKCSFTEIDYLTVAASKLPSLVSAGLISHPDTNYVVQQLDPTAGLTIQAIQAAGKSNSIKFTSIGGGLDAMQRIKSGQGQFLDVGISGIYTGWQFTDGIARMIAGSLPVVTLSAMRLITKANVGTLTLTPSAYSSNAWYGNDSYIASFSKAWGLN